MANAIEIATNKEMRRKIRKTIKSKSSKLTKILKKRKKKKKTQKGKGWFSKNANLIKRIFGG